jgi:hypothetical protein
MELLPSGHLDSESHSVSTHTLQVVSDDYALPVKLSGFVVRRTSKCGTRNAEDHA